MCEHVSCVSVHAEVCKCGSVCIPTGLASEVVLLLMKKLREGPGCGVPYSGPTAAPR